MTAEWQRNADDRIETTKNHDPQFKVWQSHDPADNFWNLYIWQNADQEPIRVLGLQSPEAVEKFVRGFLKDSDYRADVA